jgi:hypothetical protein
VSAKLRSSALRWVADASGDRPCRARRARGGPPTKSYLDSSCKPRCSPVPTSGMVAVSIEESFSIFQLLGDEVEVGDVVSWGATRPGSETITNHTRGTESKSTLRATGSPASSFGPNCVLEGGSPSRSTPIAFKPESYAATNVVPLPADGSGSGCRVGISRGSTASTTAATPAPSPRSRAGSGAAGRSAHPTRRLDPRDPSTNRGRPIRRARSLVPSDRYPREEARD